MNRPDNLESIEAIILQGEGLVGCAIVQGEKVCFDRARMFSGGRLMLVQEPTRVGSRRVPRFGKAADPTVAAYIQKRFGNS